MNDNKCIRVLRIVAVMNRGGIETQIMNMYRKLDRSRFQFDFLVTRDETGIFDEEIKTMGGRIYRVSSIRDVGLFSFIKSIDDFFREHKEYKIVHSHMNTWSGLFLGIAKRHGVKVRIAQSHSAQQGQRKNTPKDKLEDLFKKIMRFFIKYNATDFWAVGQSAGEWLYGNKIASTQMKIIPNAKDLDSYRFDLENRKELRNEINLPNDAFVIGHVGSFSPVKNHEFLISVFGKVLKQDKNSYLCLVGNGPMRNDIADKISKEKIEENVRQLGLRNDVNELMSIFDVLLLPSMFEGMPNVIIEAQASGLPCIVSDTITKEIDFGMDLVEYLPLSSSFETWSNVILKKKGLNRSTNINAIREKGYDLDNLINELQVYYDSVIEKNK